MTERTQEDQPKGIARRKLVRGVFAAPAVLTLHSGGAMAATSNMRCLVTRNAAPVMAAVTTGANADQYLRYQLWSVTKNSDKSVTYWVKGSDLSVYIRNGRTPYPSLSQAQQVDITNNTASAPITYAAPDATQYTVARCNKYVVLRIDANGGVVGVASGSSGSAVSGSCWNSFAGGTA